LIANALMFPRDPRPGERSDSSRAPEYPGRFKEDAHRRKARAGDRFVKLAEGNTAGEANAARSLEAKSQLNAAVAVGDMIRVAVVRDRVKGYRKVNS
jgi:hypothetical protein